MDLLAYFYGFVKNEIEKWKTFEFVNSLLEHFIEQLLNLALADICEI